MRLLALITGLLSALVFIWMLLVLLVAPLYLDIDMDMILKIRGYGLLLISTPIISMGLLLAAYESMGEIYK